MNTRKPSIKLIGALLLAFAALVALSFLLGAGTAALAAPAAAPSAQASVGTMPALPDAVCTLTATGRSCELWAKAGTLAMPDGTSVPIWGFAVSSADPALVPGPVIQAEVGETLEIVLHNELPNGMAVSLGFPGMDAVVPDMVGAASGLAKSYTVELPDVMGTYLYEAGMTENGGRQVAMGLAGPLIVSDPAATPEWQQEAMLVLNEVDPDFNADPLNYSLVEFKPRYWLFNGKAFPDTGALDVAAGSTVLMRYLNAGVNDHFMGILGLNQKIIAIDGRRLSGESGMPHPYSVFGENVDSGQTLEALVTIPAAAAMEQLYPVYDTSLIQHNNNQRQTGGSAAFGGMLAFLRVTDVVVNDLGPVASNLSATPEHTNGSVEVVFEATLTDPDSGDVVEAYEIVLDDPALFGTNPVNVAVPANSVTVNQTFTVADLQALATGEHSIYIRGWDGTTWGPMNSASFILEKGGPAISGMSFHRSPTNGSMDVLLRATGDDRTNGNTPVVAGEYRIDGGAWQTMALNRTNHPVAAMTATIPMAVVDGLSEGIHLVEVQAQDGEGNWTPDTELGAINLLVDESGPEVQTVVLNPTVVDVTQPAVAGVVRVDGMVADPLVADVQSPIVHVEGFINSVGTLGEGFAVYPADGLFDETIEAVYYNIPLPYFNILPAGIHEVLLVGKDSAGNWTVLAGSAQIEVIK